MLFSHSASAFLKFKTCQLLFVSLVLSCVQFFVTPWTMGSQVHLSLGFSRQEYWSGLPFPSPGGWYTWPLRMFPNILFIFHFISLWNMYFIMVLTVSNSKHNAPFSMISLLPFKIFLTFFDSKIPWENRFLISSYILQTCNISIKSF